MRNGFVLVWVTAGFSNFALLQWLGASQGRSCACPGRSYIIASSTQ